MEKSGNFAQNWAQNCADWYMSHFFLKNCYLYGSNFKFRGGTSLPEPNLSIPPEKKTKTKTKHSTIGDLPRIYPRQSAIVYFTCQFYFELLNDLKFMTFL